MNALQPMLTEHFKSFTWSGQAVWLEWSDFVL